MLRTRGVKLVGLQSNRLRNAVVLLIAVVMCACADNSRSLLSPPVRSLTSASPARPAASDSSRYIIAFKSSVEDAAAAATTVEALAGGQRLHLFTTGRKAVVLRGLPPNAIAALSKLPNVEYVEHDHVVRFTAAQSLSSSQWALDRIDSPLGARVFDQTFNYYFTGAGVHVYIVDTGIDRNNPDIAARLSSSGVCTFNGGGCDPNVDTFGHGTAVASVAAGNVYGVAKGATLHSIRIADGEGSFQSNIGAGLDWVRVNGTHPGVVNISLGDPNGDVYLDDGILRFLSEKINEVIQTGYVVTKSGGNEGKDACGDPQDTRQGEIVLAASDINDNRPSWSGNGGCISLFAPGVDVATTPTPLGTSLSGTSLSAPIVAGVAAQILQEQPTLNSGQVLSELQNSANRVINDATTPNNLLVNALHQTATPVTGRTSIQSSDVDQTTVYRVTVHGGDPSHWSYVWFESNHTNFATQATSSGNAYTRTIHAGESGWTTITVQATSAGVTLMRSTTLTITNGACSPAC
jgi:subtilisin family serine protease